MQHGVVPLALVEACPDPFLNLALSICSTWVGITDQAIHWITSAALLAALPIHHFVRLMTQRNWILAYKISSLNWRNVTSLSCSLVHILTNPAVTLHWEVVVHIYERRSNIWALFFPYYANNNLNDLTI